MEPYDPRAVTHVVKPSPDPKPDASKPRPVESFAKLQAEVTERMDNAWEVRNTVCEVALNQEQGQPLDLPENFLDSLTELEAGATKLVDYVNKLEVAKKDLQASKIDKKQKEKEEKEIEDLLKKAMDTAEADQKMVQSIHNFIEDNNADALKFDIAKYFYHKLDYDITDVVNLVQNQIDLIKSSPDAKLEDLNKKPKPESKDPYQFKDDLKKSSPLQTDQKGTNSPNTGQQSQSPSFSSKW